MQSIQDLRVTQCPIFRKKLLDTGNLILIHNMESDEEWGLGRHWNGRNMQGKIEMRTRSKLLSGELITEEKNTTFVDKAKDFPPLPATKTTSSQTLLSNKVHILI